MRFAIFSDIHANLQAWEAVLADIQSQRVDTLVCLGDVIGYGPMPGPVLESVYQHTDNFVLGNHDAVVGGRIDAATFNEHAQYVIEWTAEQLGEEGAAFFAQVPLTLRGEKMLFTHGDAARPGHFDYVVKAEDARPSFQGCRDDVIFFGHTHDPCVFACANNKGIIDKLPGTDLLLEPGRRYMVNPGSVGDPRCATDLRGSYCIYDDETRRLSFRRVAFDVEAYRADLEASGLEAEPYFLRVIDAGSRRPEEDDELAAVQDHREEVEVDESMTAQPRALVTVGSPMANRPKLHIGQPQPHGYPHPQPYVQGYPYPQHQNQVGLPHTRRLRQPPVPPGEKRKYLTAVLCGVVLGIVALIVVLLQASKPSLADLADVESSGKKRIADELTEGDGWEDADQRPEKGASAVSPGPVFSLSSMVNKPFDRYEVNLPEGVALVDRAGGGQSLRFGDSAGSVEIPDLKEANFGGSMSVAAWIRISPTDEERLIYLRKDGSSPSIYLKVTARSDAKPGCVVFGGKGMSPGSVRSSSKNRVDDGKWHFVMAMHDQEEKKLRIYIDGKISKSAANIKGTVPDCRGSIWVGDEGFAGEIYGMRLFDWALATADMKKVFENGD